MWGYSSDTTPHMGIAQQFTYSVPISGTFNVKGLCKVMLFWKIGNVSCLQVPHCLVDIIHPAKITNQTSQSER